MYPLKIDSGMRIATEQNGEFKNANPYFSVTVKPFFFLAQSVECIAILILINMFTVIF